jgi:hypothetical protein
MSMLQADDTTERKGHPHGNDKILVGLSILDVSSESGSPTSRWQILTVKCGLVTDIRGFEYRDDAVSRME